MAVRDRPQPADDRVAPQTGPTPSSTRPPQTPGTRPPSRRSTRWSPPRFAGSVPAEREVLLLVAWDDLTPAQGAEALGISGRRLSRPPASRSPPLPAADGPARARRRPLPDRGNGVRMNHMERLRNAAPAAPSPALDRNAAVRGHRRPARRPGRRLPAPPRPLDAPQADDRAGCSRDRGADRGDRPCDRVPRLARRDRDHREAAAVGVALPGGHPRADPATRRDRGRTGRCLQTRSPA